MTEATGQARKGEDGLYDSEKVEVAMSETRGKQEHTPLPWTVGTNGDDEAEGKFYLIGGNGLFFGRIPRDLKEPEFRANAELIVQAVNSHQQLVDAIGQYEQAVIELTDQQLVDNPVLMNAVVCGRAALKAAAGERDEIK